MFPGLGHLSGQPRPKFYHPHYKIYTLHLGLNPPTFGFKPLSPIPLQEAPLKSFPLSFKCWKATINSPWSPFPAPGRPSPAFPHGQSSFSHLWQCAHAYPRGWDSPSVCWDGSGRHFRPVWQLSCLCLLCISDPALAQVTSTSSWDWQTGSFFLFFKFFFFSVASIFNFFNLRFVKNRKKKSHHLFSRDAV